MRVLDSACGAYITVEGHKLLNLCSNNYLGLAADERVTRAAIRAIRTFGVGAGASRLVVGNTRLHEQLEKKLAGFKKQQACLVYPTGYSANLGIISALAGRGDIVFCDRLNHASIIDGIVLSRAELIRYSHKDLGALERLLQKSPKRKRKLIVTDSVFSMDGDIAPIPRLLGIAREYDCLLVLDEAHATGVLGKNGTGALEHFGLRANARVVQMGTLSKAVGCLGGFVCGSRDLIEYLVNRSRPFIFTTGLPAAICASALAALAIIEKDDELRKRLWHNAAFLRDGLNSLGFETLASETAIMPVLTKEPALTMEFSRRLFEQGVFVRGIRPPTVPQGMSRLRVTVMATHEKEDLTFALEKFHMVGKTLCLI